MRGYLQVGDATSTFCITSAMSQPQTRGWLFTLTASAGFRAL